MVATELQPATPASAGRPAFGTEFALTDRWPIKGEFDWLDFGQLRRAHSARMASAFRPPRWLRRP
jgi:hypothetical protein